MLSKEQYIQQMTKLVMEQWVTDDNCLRPYVPIEELQLRVFNEFKQWVHESGIKDFTLIQCSFNKFWFAWFIDEHTGEFIYSFWPSNYARI